MTQQKFNIIGVLAQSKENDKQIEKGKLQVKYQWLFGKKIDYQFEKSTIKRITDFLTKIKDHEFNQLIYSIKEYEEIKKILSQNILIELLKILVHPTALDEEDSLYGSNSLHLLVQMKVDLREESFVNIRIRNTSLIAANLARCDLSDSDLTMSLIVE
ncbi:unnamed protein product [Paramecium octaurelia]|uniref:Uncharacterized protein n=1 Tax=Paramecium octaurelia TaxID=43137 RepID=A0A8S1YLR1_PAROT|nr:unnamed protein product [Paramecium octaurelia]